MTEKIKRESPLSVTQHYSGSGKHVALLHGGMSLEREVSLESGKSVLTSLLNMGYRVTAIDPGVDISQVLLSAAPDVVFNCLHGTYGEDGTISGLLDMLRLPYTHSGARASYICFNKDVTKRICKEIGLLTPKACLVRKGHEKKCSMQPPYVIKPLAQGSSLGVEVVFPDEPGIESYSFAYGQTVLVEEYIKGREIQVALLNGKALGLLELKCTKKRFYDYETKYTPGLAEHLLKPHLPKSIKHDILSAAERIYAYVGCRGIARAEFIYSEAEGKAYFLEINTHPGFTALSICPEIASLSGISTEMLVKACLDTACFDKSPGPTDVPISLEAAVGANEARFRSASSKLKLS